MPAEAPPVSDKAEARDAISKLIYGYAEALDTRRWELFEEVFTPDVVFDFEVWQVEGIEAAVAKIRTFLDGCGPTQHLQGNYRIALFASSGGTETPYPTLGYTLSVDPNAEAPKDRFNTALLERLAQRSGGAINPDLLEEVKTEEVQRLSHSLRSFPLFLAALFFLLEIFLGRLIPW